MRSKFKWIFTLILALTVQFSFAQEKTVTGVVSDATGTLPGANVIVKGTTKGTQTDIDGRYTITANVGETLVFSYVGMADKEIKVGASNLINVTLEQGVALTEVIIEGYRSTTKTTTVVAQTTVNAKTIENRPNASFVQTLQGQVAGLNILTGSGQPGASSTVLIRGANSITGTTDPLYVIDGIPTNTTNFRTINPEDIESVTVLKDASATAIYGNRGSNGVIVITTRRGSFEDGKMNIRYSVSTGITSLQNTGYSFANSRQMLELERTYGVGRGASNPDTGAPFTDAEIAAYGINTDWVDYFFRDATSSTHQLSFENQGKLLNSYTSVGYTDQQGLLRTTAMKRFSFRNNLSGKSNNEKLQYNTSLSLAFTRNNEATSLGTGAINRNYVLGATLGMPYISPDEYQNSAQLLDLYQTDGTLLYTPLFLIDKLETYENNTDEFRMLASADVSYELFKDFRLLTRTSVDLVTSRFTQSEHPNSFNAVLFQEAEFGGFEDINNARTYRFSQLWQASYNRTFAEKHTVAALAATEYNMSQFDANNVRQNGLDPSVFVPGTGSGWLADIEEHDFYGTQSSMGKLKYNLLSYFTTVDYDYDNRYGVVGSFRYDGSSRFASDRRWGSFWSVGARWNISNEKFMDNSNFVQVLKLRASYGSTGNQRYIGGSEFNGTNPPGFIDTYEITGNVYNGASGALINFGDVDLRWETTYQANVGLDFEVYKNRLKGTVDVYNKRTVDLFYDDDTSPVGGTLGIERNTDIVLSNRGIEASLSYDVVRNQDWKVTVRGNMSYNDNEVSHMDDPGYIIDGNYITRNGGQAFEYYVIPYAGVNPDNGNLQFLAADGSLTENPDEIDRRVTRKSEIPIYQGGFGFDIDYKGFFATTNFTFAQKVWRFDFDLDGLYDPTQLGQFVVTDDLLNAWTPENPDTDVPSLTASNLGEAANSDRFLRNASYVRLRYAQIGYRVPQKFLDKTFFAGVTFYVQGENLYTWTNWQGFDAESNRAGDQGQYPTPKIVSFGMDLRF